jgi:Na+-transporting NADH:ubiquinone oxidoreductase subunit NqrB
MSVPLGPADDHATGLAAALATAAPLLVTAAAIVLAAATWAVTRRANPALPVLLDLLMTAGLLRLTVEQDWRAIAGAAAVVVVRKLVVAGIGRGRTAHGRLLPRPPGPVSPT